jgi:[NiFe] hydrogenase diaphorase moiety small subunit
MSEAITITIDGVAVNCRRGQTIIAAADDAGIYIPRLCYLKEMAPSGRCRVCTVSVNGRLMTACTTPVVNGMVVLNETAQLNDYRRALVEMLFAEGNHICPFCEASGKCELQALGYRLKMLVPRFPFMFPRRAMDMSHPDVWIDRNRCIQCGRCVRASRDSDGKNVFGFVGRSLEMQLGVNGESLSETDLAATDRAASACPTGALLIKRKGWVDPYGTLPYQREPIGSDIEKSKPPAPAKK